MTISALLRREGSLPRLDGVGCVYVAESPLCPPGAYTAVEAFGEPGKVFVGVDVHRVAVCNPAPFAGRPWRRLDLVAHSEIRIGPGRFQDELLIVCEAIHGAILWACERRPYRLGGSVGHAAWGARLTDGKLVAVVAGIGDPAGARS